MNCTKTLLGTVVSPLASGLSSPVSIISASPVVVAEVPVVAQYLSAPVSCPEALARSIPLPAPTTVATTVPASAPCSPSICSVSVPLSVSVSVSVAISSPFDTSFVHAGGRCGVFGPNRLRVACTNLIHGCLELQNGSPYEE